MSSGPIEFSLTLPRYQDLGERDPYPPDLRVRPPRREHRLRRRLRRPPLLHARDQGPVGPVRAARRRSRRAPSSLRLGTGVFLGALHHPVNICEQVSTLDQISNGRAVLGLGTGYRPYEFKAYGSPFGQRGRRLSETHRGAAQRLDHRELPLRRRVLPVRRPRGVPALRAAAPPADLRRRHVRGGDPAGGPAGRHLVHAADGDAALRAEPRRPLPGRVRDLRHDASDLPDARGVGGDQRRGRRARSGSAAPCRSTATTGRPAPGATTTTRCCSGSATGQPVGLPGVRAATERSPGRPISSSTRSSAGTTAIDFDEACLIFATAREATDQATLTEAVTLFADEVMPAFR